MDIALRIELLVPGAEYFGAPTNRGEYEQDVIWKDERPKPLWSAIAALDEQEGAEIERQAALDDLARTDKLMARAAEDVIAALEAKGLVAVADLPAAVQENLARRQAARAKL
jgi:hypothetical protein